MWMTSPERSLGSNQVVFGGMIFPESAMLISCCIDTGKRAKATFALPESTRFCNSPRPRIPPTKSMRVEVRRSSIPSTWSSTRLDKMVTSSTPIGSLSLKVPGLEVSLYQFPEISLKHSITLHHESITYKAY